MAVRTADFILLGRRLARKGYCQKTLGALAELLALDWRGESIPVRDICMSVETVYYAGGDNSTLRQVLSAIEGM